eukprot:591484-Prorocentrum_lima.AAC.1
MHCSLASHFVVSTPLRSSMACMHPHTLMEIVHLPGPSSLGDIEGTLDGPESWLVHVQAALIMVGEPCHSIAVVAEPGMVPWPTS